MPSLRRYSAAAGLLVLMFSIQLGNWVGYAWCLASVGNTAAEVRDCNCDAYLAASPVWSGSGAELGSSTFKSLAVEGLPESPASMLHCINKKSQRGLQCPSSLYSDPFADPLFHPPGKAC
jgi:hypothetical protein